ncbi:MAG TPA: ABC transporter ATP-binding protein [Thermoplasmatales archaeon]|nr:ABC transporter ATP-binding protein [Candidatus Thermoplasmatota archaeon]MDD5778127.1 ABC transporter ATP-binding protein [Candidatus Thermoplasmatota archaeon]HDS59447.1 ABC transporter ATP-binding protein [Thermoplasmatales archaeon]
MSSESELVVLDHVSKQYRDLTALDDVSFSIRRGEVFGYIGPNGAGKTTTIKIMVGLLRQSRGTLTINGHRMPEEKEQAHRMLGYLPQKVAFQEWRTVDHALSTLGRLSGLSGHELERRITEVLDFLGLTKVRRKKIIQLSGGMVQKVGLAQALLHRPPLLVLDEPLAGLDPASRYQVKQIIRELSRGDTTIFFSSHILSDVQDVATRIGILNHGHVMQVGTLEELKAEFTITRDIAIALAADCSGWSDLKSLEGVGEVEQPAPRRLVVRVAGDADLDETGYRVMRELLDRGCRIRSFTPVTPSLDEVYLRYVGGEQT